MMEQVPAMKRERASYLGRIIDSPGAEPMFGSNKTDPFRARKIRFGRSFCTLLTLRCRWAIVRLSMCARGSRRSRTGGTRSSGAARACVASQSEERPRRAASAAALARPTLSAFSSVGFEPNRNERSGCTKSERTFGKRQIGTPVRKIMFADVTHSCRIEALALSDRPFGSRETEVS